MIGQAIGHYRVQEKIGTGGMGEVYRARDERLDRDVALKVLPAGMLTDDNARSRFRREAQALSRLNHPNIAVIYDFDSEGSMDFLAMEYVVGETLAARIATVPLPEKVVLDLGTQIAEALDEAHEHGIIHRDLKPANLMVTPKGRLKVLDFGLAKLLRPIGLDEAAITLAETQAGAVMGTLPYMAPEQLQGKPVDARADLYALGAVLYEMATGRRPFPATQASQLIAEILARGPRRPRELNGQVSLGLEGVILKALEKDPERRYQSAEEMLDDLSRVSVPGSVVKALKPTKTKRWALVTVGAAGLIVAFALLAGLNVRALRERLLGRGSTPQVHSLAVLPLENLSSDKEQEYFAEGMTEELITDLAKISALKVISRNSVLPYRNTRKSTHQIGSELQADTLIEGSVMRSGDRVRITVQLLDASSDQHLWAESYERDLKDVFALQGEVAQAIAQQVRAAITPQERSRLVKKSPVDPEVYELYLKGRHIMTRGGLEDVRKAIEYFQSGLAKDPNNALIYTGLADAYIQQMSDVHESPVEAAARSRAAATRALELDESLAEAHASLGTIKLYYDWDWPGAQTEFKHAMDLDPGYSAAYADYGEYLTLLGRLPEALPYFEKARRLDPLDPMTYRVEGYSYFMAHKYDEAVEQYRKCLELEPDQITYFGLVLALAEKGDYATAIAGAEKATKLDSSPLLLTGLASAYARAGRRADSYRLLRRLEEIAKVQGPAPAWHEAHAQYVCPYEVAGVCAQLGDKDKAFEWLGKAYQSRSCLYWLPQDPRLDSLRSDPRFQELLHRLNFPQ